MAPRRSWAPPVGCAGPWNLQQCLFPKHHSRLSKIPRTNWIIPICLP